MGRYITIDTPPTALDSTPLPYQRLEAPLAAFGGNDANALAQFGSALGRNVANFRDQAKQQQLLNHESEANDAMTAHRLQTTATLGQYTGTRMKETVDSYPSARQALQASHDAALDQVSPAAAALLKPHLGRSLNDALQVAQDHQLRQDHAWSDQSSLDSMRANLQEALLHRDDANKVQQMADHSSGEWLKIGERKGWSPQIINQQSDQTKAELFGTVIQAHLQDGRPDQAQSIFDRANHQLDPDTMQRMVQSLQVPQPGGANQPAPDSYRYQGDPNADLTMPYRYTPGQEPATPPLEQPRPFNFNGPNGNGDPKLFQINAPVGGQQFAQNTTAPGTAIDTPSQDPAIPVSDNELAGKRGLAPPTDPDVSGADPNRPVDPSIPVPKWVTPGFYMISPSAKKFNTDRPRDRPKKYVPHPYNLAPENVGDQEIDPNEMYADLEFNPKGAGEFWTGIANPWEAADVKFFLKDHAEKLTFKLIDEGKLPPGRPVDNAADAFRHAYGSYLAAHRYGPYVAKAFGDAHEISGDADGNTLGASMMDLYNNRIGRILARDPANANRDPAEVILEALHKGLLRISPFKVKQP